MSRHSEAGAVARVKALESRLNLRRAVQRAMVMGRLYGGGALIVGTRETDPAALARELRPETLGEGGLAVLHPVSRWQLAVEDIERDPLSPWYGEPKAYQVVAPERGTLTLHPSRVIRFLGAPLADPALMGADLWSDSVLTALYDAIHAVALTTTGATSLMHEAKVDVVTVPNLSEHLSNAATTAQLSARFGYAAAMKSMNNLLLLGDGETWARQRVDFAGLPEMVRTFLQIAAGAADIPVTRLLGQSPAGLSSTGDHDTRNYYDMIAARQEIELRPQLERLDRLLMASVGVAPGALSFTFRPLWQMDAATKAATALQKAQATGIYAGLGLWPKDVMAGLVAGQLAEDGIYPDADTVLSGDGRSTPNNGGPDFLPDHPANDWPGQPRNRGEYAEGKMGGDLPIIQVAHFWERGNKERKRRRERRAREEKRQSHEEHEQEQKTPSHAAPEKAREPEKQEPDGSLSSWAGVTSPQPPLPSVLAPPPPAIFDPAVPASVGLGSFARAAVPAGPSPRPTPSQKILINEIGKRYGCHTCGIMDPGTDSGNWVGDHQPPTSLTSPGALQFYLPHCRQCSLRQGGFLRGFLSRGSKQ